MKRRHRQLLKAADAKKEQPSSPWWDIFSHCKDWEEHDDYYLHDDSKSNSDCVASAGGGILSFCRPMPQAPNDEDRQDEVMTLHHQIGPLSAHETCTDVLRVRDNDRVDDNNIKSNPISTDDTPTSINSSDDNSIREDIDAAMSQFVLSRILGSIDPSAVAEKERDKGITLLCDLDEGNIRGHFDFDDILDEGEEEKDEFNLDAFVVKNGDINDTNTTASLSSEDDAYESDDIFSLASDIIFSELHACHDYIPHEPTATSSSHHVKDLANTVLAWGALSIILNAPAPSALNVHNKGGATTSFEEDEGTIDLDDIFSHSKDEQDELESVVDDDDIFQHWLHRQTSGVLMKY